MILLTISILFGATPIFQLTLAYLRISGQDEYADGMVEHDMHVGKLLNKLDELGVADNTIVFYSTDNRFKRTGRTVELWRRDCARDCGVGFFQASKQQGRRTEQRKVKPPKLTAES